MVFYLVLVARSITNEGKEKLNSTFKKTQMLLPLFRNKMTKIVGSDKRNLWGTKMLHKWIKRQKYFSSLKGTSPVPRTRQSYTKSQNNKFCIALWLGRPYFIRKITVCYWNAQTFSWVIFLQTQLKKTVNVSLNLEPWTAVCLHLSFQTFRLDVE